MPLELWLLAWIFFGPASEAATAPPYPLDPIGSLHPGGVNWTDQIRQIPWESRLLEEDCFQVRNNINMCGFEDFTWYVTMILSIPYRVLTCSYHAHRVLTLSFMVGYFFAYTHLLGVRFWVFHSFAFYLGFVLSFVQCVPSAHGPTRPGAVASLVPRLRFNFDAAWFVRQALSVSCCHEQMWDWFNWHPPKKKDLYGFVGVS